MQLTCLFVCLFLCKKSYHLPFERLKLLCCDYFQTEDQSEADKALTSCGYAYGVYFQTPRSCKRLMLGMQKLLAQRLRLKQDNGGSPCTSVALALLVQQKINGHYRLYVPKVQLTSPLERGGGLSKLV